MYIIAGPNGAGKTTLSYTLLPEIFRCDEFINADEIARGISPLNPEKAALRAGRLMLSRMDELLKKGDSFAFETTLSTKSYAHFIKEAKANGYLVILLFLALDSVELAVQRVKTRVSEGGHNIPEEVIKRRFRNGLTNFFDLYEPIVDQWIFVDNSQDDFEQIAKGTYDDEIVLNLEKWRDIKLKYDDK